MEGREHAKRSDYESFLRGDGVTIKTQGDKTVEYAWVKAKGDPVTHAETPMNDKDSRRFWVEMKKDGKERLVDAKSMKIWKTKELPRFLREEQEAQQAQRPPRARTPTTPNPPVDTQNTQEAPGSPEVPLPTQTTPPPTRAPTHQQAEREVTQPEEEGDHREPAKEPQEKKGTMDGRNHRKFHTDNIIGDKN